MMRSISAVSSLTFSGILLVFGCGAQDDAPSTPRDAAYDTGEATDAARTDSQAIDAARDAAASPDGGADASVADSASGATDSGAPDVTVDSAVPDATGPSPFDAGFDAQLQDAGSGTAPGDADADACDACQEPKFKIEMGYYFGCAWRSGGPAKCWGSNASGQLGLGTRSDPKVAANPVTPSWPAISLGSNARVDSLVAGSFHACAILSDGSVRCWGSNSYGQLGYGDTKTRGLNADELGAALPKVQLGTGRTARKIAAGNGHSCALLDDGSVKCWGHNHAGQLGIGTGDNRGDEANEMGDELPRVDLGTGRTARTISAGSFHTCALLDDATVKCWGHNQHGQLGLGDVENRGDGAGELGDALPAVLLGGGSVVSIYAGGYTSCAFIANGSVKCWGRNVKGELGLGDTQVRGDQPADMGRALPSLPLPAGRSCVEVAAGLYHLCALLDDGSVRCFGEGVEGQLGSGSTESLGDSPDEIGERARVVDLAGAEIVHLSAGALSLCALSRQDELRCWGRNSDGELGIEGSNRGDTPGEMGRALPAFTPF